MTDLPRPWYYGKSLNPRDLARVDDAPECDCESCRVRRAQENAQESEPYTVAVPPVAYLDV